MTNKVHGTQLMRFVFLDLKSLGYFADNILSYETVDPFLKMFTFLKR